VNNIAVLCTLNVNTSLALICDQCQPYAIFIYQGWHELQIRASNRMIIGIRCRRHQSPISMV